MNRASLALLGSLVALLGCATPLEKGEELYRQGALREAVGVWEQIPDHASDYAQAQERIGLVTGELDRMLRRFEKQAEFFEAEGRLGEAVLYYRLAIKMEPARSETLERVQALVRELDQQERRERAAMRQALEAGNLLRASSHAQRLQRLAPFDPAVQLEIRQVQAAIGAEVLGYVEAGKRAYQEGNPEAARKAFRAVQRIDADNQEALGYLEYIRRSEVPSPGAISREEIIAEGHYRSGQQALQQQQPFRALDEFESALRLNPGHVGARQARARVRRDLSPRAAELYEEGKRYFQEDDLHNALRSWERVLLIQPDHARAQENADRTKRILQRLEEIQAGGS